MRVLNIHGYQGNSRNSAYTALQSIGCDIISPQIDYDAEKPESIIDKLSRIVIENQAEILVGTSFGGFFAAILCVDLNIPVILVNPCLLPFLYLPRLGYQGDIQPFIKQFSKLTLIDREKVSCIVGASDEVIDSHDFDERILGTAHFRVVPGGRHSGSTLPLKEYFEFIVNANLM